MFRITPIGTCRIHTPLTRAVSRYPIELDLRRNYGFVHTSDEALQQLRYLQGEKRFQQEAIPLVFRPGDAEELGRQSWEPSDLHVIEISSAKRVLCGEDAVQINYLYRHFGDFFGSSERARQFWNLVRGGHRMELLDFLKQQPSFEMMPTADRELLMNLTTEQQTFRHVKADMEEIIERLGKERVLFVTHVNAVAADGEVIPSRDRLIRWVKLAADQLGAAVFDPTGAMAEFGQERALESGGLDLTHFTLPFSDRLYDVLHQQHVAAHIGSQAAGSGLDEQSMELARLAARIESMIGGSKFLTGSRELHAAIEQFPDSIPLRNLRGVVRSRIGDFRGAIADLRAGDAATNLSPSMRIALLESFNAAGQYEDALTVADGLIWEEVDNAAIHRIAADASDKLGRVELAISHAKQAYRLDRGDLSAAIHALTLLTSSGNAAEIGEWRKEVLENIGSSSSGSFELCHWAVGHGDEDLFAASLPLVASTDKWSAIDLMEEALGARLPRAIAASIPVAVELGRLAPGLADRRSAIIQGATDLAREFADAGQVDPAYQIARAMASLPHVDNRQILTARIAGEGRRLVRDLVVEARDAIWQLHLAEDPQAVVELGKAIGDILLEDGKSAATVARAYQATGDAKGGLDLLKRVGPGAADNLMVRRWTARLAQSVQDYATALEMSGWLRDQGGPEAKKFGAETSRFFGAAANRSVKKLSLLARGGEYDEALRLADAIRKHLGPNERVDLEMARMFKMLKIRLNQIQEGDGDLDEREPVLRRMVQARPDDGSTLRRLALELMRQFRFAEAAECWERLYAQDPGNESADRNRVRCATLAKRRASASAQVVDIMS